MKQYHYLGQSALLLSLLLTGAESAQNQGVTVRFKPVFNGVPLQLEQRSYTTAQGEAVVITACRLYVSGLQLQYRDGSTYHEPTSYHLLDAEADSTWTIRLPLAPNQPLTALAFSVGVDSLANVTGAHTGALDPARGMYWAWHSGYVNAKLEGRSPQAGSPRREFEFHVGGYAAPASTLRRVRLPVAGSAAGPLLVLADVGAWLRGVRLVTTYSVLTPGPAAQALADGYARMFRLTPGAAARP